MAKRYNIKTIDELEKINKVLRQQNIAGVKENKKALKMIRKLLKYEIKHKGLCTLKRKSRKVKDCICDRDKTITQANKLLED
jgi:hypothetical protein